MTLGKFRLDDTRNLSAPLEGHEWKTMVQYSKPLFNRLGGRMHSVGRHSSPQQLALPLEC
jgi:hypothetical protein